MSNKMVEFHEATEKQVDSMIKKLQSQIVKSLIPLEGK